MEELGAGFVLATHDLEIRGAGELLGEQQSGEMTEIGLALYLDMLEQAVKALKEGREPALDQPLAADHRSGAARCRRSCPRATWPTCTCAWRCTSASPRRQTSRPRRTDRGDRSTASGRCRRRRRTCCGSRGSNWPRARSASAASTSGPRAATVFEERARIDPATVVRLIQKQSREYRLEGPLKLRVTRQLGTEDASASSSRPSC